MLSNDSGARTENARPARPALRALAAAALVVACAAAAGAQTQVPDGTGRVWVNAGMAVENGTLVEIGATGTVNVGPRGSFGPTGTTAFPGDYSQDFPSDVRHLYGLVIRLTASPTNPLDETRQDYAYGDSWRICFRARGHLWLAVNDSQPADNTGYFVVTLRRAGACEPGDPGGRSTRVRVSDEGGAGVPGADVYLNGWRAGATGGDGTLLLPGLRAGDRLIARKLVRENSTTRADHSAGGTRDWNYRVYLTTAPVSDTGAVSPFVVLYPGITQELSLSRTNTLVGLHLVASIESDAHADDLRTIRDNLVASAQALYDATDGQFFFEQIDLFDRGDASRSADVRVLANWSLRENAYGGGFFGDRGQLNMQRLSGAVAYVHEFGHYGFDLWDEYADGDDTVYCTRALSTAGPYGWREGNRQPQASCVMYTDPPKFCSAHPWNPHVGGTRQGDEDCWSQIVRLYRDRETPARWTLQTPATRGAIPGMLPPFPVDSWNPRFNDYTHDYEGLCPPMRFVVADGSGRRLPSVNVYQIVRSGAWIYQGMSREENPRTPEIEEGEMVATGLHDGDELLFDSGRRLHVSRCTLRAVAAAPRDGRRPSVASSPQSPAQPRAAGRAFITRASYAPAATPARQEQKDEPVKEGAVVVVDPPPYEVSVSLEPGGAAGQAVVRVSAGVPLPGPPQARLTLGGETRNQEVSLRFDAGANAFVGMIGQLPEHGTGVIQVVADDGARRTELMRQVSFATVFGKGEAEVFSADGQLSLSVPAGALPEGTRIITGPSDAPAPALPEGLEVISGPFRVAASGHDRLASSGTLRFQLPDRAPTESGGGRNGAEGYDPTSFEIRRYDESDGSWEAAGGLLLREVAVVSLKTEQLGTYALVARPLSTAGAKTAAREPGAKGVSDDAGEVAASTLSGVVARYYRVPFTATGARADGRPRHLHGRTR